MQEQLTREKIALHIGHRALAAMLAMDATKAVFTTNFDEVIEVAYADVAGKPLLAFSLDGSYAALDALNAEKFPLYAKLHGDFRFRKLKNLSTNLQHNDVEIGRAFVTAANRFGMIVTGYSGRDANVMQLFHDALDQPNPFPGGLYWCITRPEDVMPTVVELVSKARAKGVTAGIVEAGTFDILLMRVWQQLPDRLEALDAKVQPILDRQVNIALPTAGNAYPLIRTNALPIKSLPSVCGCVECAPPMTWERLRAAQGDTIPKSSIAIEGDVLFWGSQEEVEGFLKECTTVRCGTRNFDNPLAAIESSPVLKGLFENGLACALVADKPVVLRKWRRQFFAVASYKREDADKLATLAMAIGGGPVTGMVPRTNLKWAEAVSIKLDVQEGRAYLLLNPMIWITPVARRENAEAFVRARQIKRYNNISDAILDAWVRILVGDRKGKDVTVTAFDRRDATASFVINTRTAFSKVGGGRVSDLSSLAACTLLREPDLLFAGGQQNKHPLLGLTKHGPYSLDLRWPLSVRLAFFAPKTAMSRLDALVTELQSDVAVKDAPNYYLPYPGFTKAFRVPLETATGNLRVEASDHCIAAATAGDGAMLAQAIGEDLQPLIHSRRSFEVLIIFLPTAWDRAFNAEGFDLHHVLKAQLAPTDVAIQIVKEKTEERDRAQVMWGISQALYAKAGGIPFKLADYNRDEAYIGLSYAMKRGRNGMEYTTCCSQVFDPDGTGFEFVAFDTREFTTDRQGNPYLRYQEMQAVLSKSLLLYQNGHRGRVPRKIFIHKTTHFTEEEILGARDAFNARTEVELVQIIRSTSWYGLKWDLQTGTDRLVPSGYPLDRGFYLPLTRNECLLWTQGSVQGINQQNISRPVFKEAPLKPLPHPILLRRFSGQSGWHDTCQTTLSLTKVDWNNNTLYKKLPATLVYSGLFAEVVKNSQDIVDSVYDYRSFM